MQTLSYCVHARGYLLPILPECMGPSPCRVGEVGERWGWGGSRARGRRGRRPLQQPSLGGFSAVVGRPSRRLRASGLVWCSSCACNPCLLRYTCPGRLVTRSLPKYACLCPKGQGTLVRSFNSLSEVERLQRTHILSARSLRQNLERTLTYYHINNCVHIQYTCTSCQTPALPRKVCSGATGRANEHLLKHSTRHSI